MKLTSIIFLITQLALSSAAIAAPPQRIVTLAPSLAELAADVLGADLSRIVGVTDYTDYPPGLKKVGSVGPYSRFNLEMVVALKPDLVLATTDGNPRDRIARLTELGLNVVVIDTENFEKIEDSIKTVARVIGNEARGIKMAEQFKRGLVHFRERATKRARLGPKVLIQVGDEPLVIAARRSFLSRALELIGAENVYADLDDRYPRSSIEDVIKRDPDKIFVLSLGPDTRDAQKHAAKWGMFKKMKAVSQDQVRILSGDSLLRPSLRLLEGIALLENAVYGEKR